MSHPPFSPPSVSFYDSRFDCRGASISLLLGCRMGRRPAWFTLAVECGAPSIALDVHFEDSRVMDKAIDRSERHGLIWEYLAPCAERLICSDQLERRS
jgi:hypothetical protein